MPKDAGNHSEKMALGLARNSSLASGLISILAVISAFVWSRLGPTRSTGVMEHQLQPMIVSYDPLIIYINNFLGEGEVQYLSKLANSSTFSHSKVRDDETGVDRTSEERTSQTAWLPLNDTVVQRVRSRAASFQGYTPTSYIEDLQVTMYQTGQQYTPHWDPLEGDEGTDRLTTIFVILEDSCSGEGLGSCGTQFPGISIDWSNEDKRWCEVVDCTEEALTIRPKAGNAVFWRNRRDDGTVHPNTLHAGLPVKKGTKIGLNIWTSSEPWKRVSR